jgi:hypothetical protein
MLAHQDFWVIIQYFKKVRAIMKPFGDRVIIQYFKKVRVIMKPFGDTSTPLRIGKTILRS